VLYKPQRSAVPAPYVILIHGSGNQDRNTPYYHSLGYTLASKGVGVLLYDKRGCGKSTGNFETCDFPDLAKDAVTAFQYIRNRPDLNARKIGFLGTSQGGWIAPLAANQLPDCAFVILNVGPAVSVFEQDLNRIQYSMTDEGLEKSSIDSAVSYAKHYFNYINTGTPKDWSALENYGAAIRKKSWAGYVNLPKTQHDADMMWWKKNKYDPADALKKMKCPVLSIFGEKDVLVPPAENKSKMESYLTLSGVEYKVLTFENCGHDMIAYQGLNGANWNWPKIFWQWRKQPPEFINAIYAWIEK
jgi:pimeloyl-ACP methyl ester carboxylesterase